MSYQKTLVFSVVLVVLSAWHYASVINATPESDISELMPPRKVNKEEKQRVLKYAATIFLSEQLMPKLDGRNETGNQSDVWINSSNVDSFPSDARKPSVIGFFRYKTNDENWQEATEGLRVKFDMQRYSHIETVHGAELKIFKNDAKDESFQGKSHRVSLYMVPATGSQEILIDIQNLDGSKTGLITGPIVGWLTFKVKSAVDKWRKTPESNHGFEVVVKHPATKKVNAKQFGLVDIDGTDDKLPFMLVFASVSQESRNLLSQRLRSNLMATQSNHKSSTGKRKSSTNGCQRHRFVISQSDLLIPDWVIWPTEKNIGKCEGDCSYIDYPPATQYDQFRKVIYHSANDRDIPRFCVPKTLKNDSVLYLTEQGDIVNGFWDAAVRDCHCN